MPAASYEQPLRHSLRANATHYEQNVVVGACSCCSGHSLALRKQLCPRTLKKNDVQTAGAGKHNRHMIRSKGGA